MAYSGKFMRRRREWKRESAGLRCFVDLARGLICHVFSDFIPTSRHLVRNVQRVLLPRIANLRHRH